MSGSLIILNSLLQSASISIGFKGAVGYRYCGIIVEPLDECTRFCDDFCSDRLKLKLNCFSLDL